jgi:hypothetical protein
LPFGHSPRGKKNFLVIKSQNDFLCKFRVYLKLQK